MQRNDADLRRAAGRTAECSDALGSLLQQEEGLLGGGEGLALEEFGHKHHGERCLNEALVRRPQSHIEQRADRLDRALMGALPEKVSIHRRLS